MVMTAGGEVLVGERALGASFLGGFIAFPGGRVDPEDEAFAADLFGGTVEPLVRRAAGLRELFEEVGVLFDGARAIAAPPALAGTSAREAYRAVGARPPVERLVAGGRWVTPESAPFRFDTTFYLTLVEGPIPVSPRTAELSWTRFVAPAELLERWRRLEVLIAPPTRFALEVLALGVEEAPRRLVAIPEAQGLEPVEFDPIDGIRCVPLLSPTLPPARHTNAYVIGEERLVIVDPAAYAPEEQDKLLAQIEALIHGGAQVEGVVLTHHHFDHVGAAMLLRRVLEVPIIAHPITRDLLAGKVEVDRVIAADDRLDLGASRSGGPFVLEVLHTPGHAPGHIVLRDRRPGGRALVAGDMVAGIGTIIIDPPEGDMAVYVASLERLASLGPSMLLPAHGPIAADGQARLRAYVAHRAQREEKIWRALASHGRARPTDLLDVAYDDAPPAAYPLAARSCLAHLLKLVQEGRATEDRGYFEARESLA